MAASESVAAPRKGGGLLGTLMPVIVLTILAAGGGAFIGQHILAAVKAASSPDVKAAPAAAAAPVTSDTAVRELPPVVTNLASPNASSWIRLQAAIVYNKADAPQMDVMAQRIDDDILAAVRTLTLAQLEGAGGLDMLREDLNERASIRSDGHVRELLLEMLVIQ